MMLPSHLLATVLAGLLVSRLRPLKPREWALAIGFGVVMDVDHLLQIPRYIGENGWASLTRPGEMLAYGGAWQGFMHTPAALALVVPACVLWRSWVPAAAWGLHMVLDFVVAAHYVRFGSLHEWAIVAGLLAAVVALLAADHKRAPHGTPFAAHAAASLGLAAAPWRR